MLAIPLVKMDSCELCPVKAYNEMLRLTPRDKESPLSLLNSGKHVYLFSFLRRFEKKLKRFVYIQIIIPLNLLREVWLHLLSGQAFYSDFIQLMGDWCSDAYKEYLQYSFNDKV